MKEGTKKDIKEMVITVFLSFLFWFALILLSVVFHWCEDDPREAEAMYEEIASHPNVVSIERWERENDWKNKMYLVVTLKNDVRMSIGYCKRGENNDIVYHYIFDINGWDLSEIVHYEDSDEYDRHVGEKVVKHFMGNNSLMYLLDNYKKLYDLYMNAPEIDRASYNTAKEIFDDIPDEGMFDAYDEETGEVIGVGKLFREKYENCECCQRNYTNE